MKKILIGSIALLVIASLIVIGYVVLQKGNTSVPSHTNNPFASTTGSGANEQNSLLLADGSVVQVPKFLLPQQPEWANTTYGYEVAQDTSKPYSILFYPGDSSFLISLTTEPLGNARIEAERDLQNKLKLTTDQMCQLRINITTSISVNENYAGRNLGFSFCPGAVQLPD